jgi:hypothetical protein
MPAAAPWGQQDGWLTRLKGGKVVRNPESADEH